MKHTFANREIKIKTLTVREVDEVLSASRKRLEAENSSSPLDTIDLLFDDALPSEAILVATDLTPEELTGDVDPKDVKQLIDKVREANPFFAAMVDRISTRAEEMLKTK